MSHLDPTRKASASELRKFGLLVGGAFLAIAAVLLWRQKPPLAIGTLAGLGGLLALFGAVAPKWLQQVYAGWIRFALLLSKVTTPIFMGIVYFGLLTPTAWLLRAFGKNPLRANRGSTAWVSRPEGARRGALERQF